MDSLGFTVELIALRGHDLFDGIHAGSQAAHQGQAVLVSHILADDNVVLVAGHLEPGARQRVRGSPIQLLDDDAGGDILEDHGAGLVGNNSLADLGLSHGVAIRGVGLLDDIITSGQAAPNDGAIVGSNALLNHLTGGGPEKLEPAIGQGAAVSSVLQADN